MISAVAARKALAASKRSSKAVYTPPVPETEPESPPSLPADAQKPSSKRKPSSSSISASAPKKKKKKAKRVEDKRPRYFEEPDEFADGQDMIIVADSEQSEAALDSLSEQDSTSRRRWTPSQLLNDSSDEEDQPATAARKAYNPTPPPNLFSTFQPISGKNTHPLTTEEITSLRLEGNAVYVLEILLDETLCMLGTYGFTLVHGSLAIYGSTLHPSTLLHRVFAPRSSPIPVLKCMASVQETSLHALLPARLRSLISDQNNSAIVLLHELRTGVQGLGRICRTFDGVFEPSRWQNTDSASQFDMPGVFNLSQPSRDVQPFFLPSTWSTALENVLKTPNPAGVYLVKGPRKSGKSTFAKVLLNQLLNQYRRVAFLECDLGQSEFTPGGMVALNIIDKPLFGPAFTHPTIPHLAHYIGGTSPKSSPSHYLSAIQATVQHYRLEIQSSFFDPAQNSSDDDSRNTDVIPVIVNTMGWTKGLGVDLELKIEDMVEPTDIFETQAPVFDSPWSAPPVASMIPQNYQGLEIKIHTLEPIPSSILSTSYSPADHRAISILSYFHANFPQDGQVANSIERTATTWSTVLPLCAMRPYQVDWTAALQKVILTGAGTEDVVPLEIERVLNASIVGLVHCEPGSFDADMESSGSSVILPYSQAAAPPAPATSACYGLALVRSVLPSSAHLHVLTPVPSTLFGQAKVIVKGEMELPVWGMLDFRSDAFLEGSVKVPYLQWGRGNGIGAEKRRVRRNLMRKGQS